VLESVREGLEGLLTILGQQVSDFAQDTRWKAASQYFPRHPRRDEALLEVCLGAIPPIPITAALNAEPAR
jgi:hypothetical protein